VINVTILYCPDGSVSSSVAPLEVFYAAGTRWNLCVSAAPEPRFSITTVSVDGQPVIGGAGVRIIPDCALCKVEHTDLVLIPSVFAWPGAAVSFDPPAVIYPARGIHGLWQQGPRSSEDLVRLIGRTRAALLTALAAPASTTGLAARTGIPVSSVSEHLSVLRANGLVSTTRTGRFLVHHRTTLGLALAGD